MPDSAPLTRELSATVPAQGTAGTAQDQTIGEVPFAGTVTGVSLISEANLAANATNYRTFTVINKGADGNGTTVVATYATDTPTTDDAADFDEKAITLSVVSGATTVAAGDILAVAETVTGTGLAHSGYEIKVEITRS